MLLDGEHAWRVVQLLAVVFTDALKQTAANALSFVRLVMDHSARELRRQPRTLGLLALFSLRGCVAHVAKPDRETALRNLAIVFDHYNEQHPHSALDYRSPRELRRLAAASI